MYKIWPRRICKNGRLSAEISGCPLGLESRGPGIDPFRASGPKWGRKWPTNGFWPHLKNGGKMAWKMRKMARKMGKKARKWFENGISDHFSHFPGHVSPIFRVRPKSIFRPFSSPISGRRPEMDLYEVYGIPTLGVFRLTFHAESLKSMFGNFKGFFPRFSSTFNQFRSIAAF